MLVVGRQHAERPAAPDGGTTGDDGGTLAPFKHDIVFTMKLTVPHSSELHQCQFVQMPTDADANVVSFAHQYTPGSHHFLLYRTDLTSIPTDLTGQYDCTQGNEPIMQHSQSIIYGAQQPTGQFAFPDPTVAVTIPKGTVLIMNTHYLNASTKNDLDTTVQIGLDTTTPDKVKTQGGFFLFYDPFIDLPAHGKASSGGNCTVPSDVNVVNAFTHYHQRGTQMQIWNDPDPTTKAAVAFYTTTDWQHPQGFNGPRVLKGGSKVRFQCDYDNSAGNDEVFQGPNALTSEMCVFAGLYYPKIGQGFEYCQDYAVNGFGDQNCNSVVTCLQACPASDAPQYTNTTVNVGPCWEKCVAPGCDGAVNGALTLFQCGATHCATECGGTDQSACVGCIATNCSAEYSACQGQTCAAP